MNNKINQQYDPLTRIAYATTSCDIGSIFVLMTKAGIYAIKLGDRPEALIKNFASEFKQASITQDDLTLKPWIKKIVQLIKGVNCKKKFPLDIQGTVFQQQVWQTLQSIPYGETRAHQKIAKSINKTKAARAIGNTCGAISCCFNNSLSSCYSE